MVWFGCEFRAESFRSARCYPCLKIQSQVTIYPNQLPLLSFLKVAAVFLQTETPSIRTTSRTVNGRGCGGTWERIMVSEQNSGSNGHSPSESTPLLGEDNIAGDSGRDSGRENGEHGIIQDGEDCGKTLVTEPTVGKLLVQMGSVWVGVFFAALGELLQLNYSKSTENR